MAAELKAIATLDTKNFEAGAAKIGQTAEKASGGLGVLGSGLNKLGAAIGAAFTVGAVVNFTKAMSEAAMATQKAANVLGISGGAMEELGDLAERTGSDAGTLQAKMTKLADSQESAILGNKEAEASFGRLGVSMQDLQALSIDELLLRVAQGAQQDGAAISDLNNIMGRGAAGEMSAMLKDLAQNGLPGVTAAVDAQIAAFSDLNSIWRQAKDDLGHLGQEILLTAAQFLGLAASDEEYARRAVAAQKQRDEANRMRLAQLAKTKEYEDKVKAALTEQKRLEELERKVSGQEKRWNAELERSKEQVADRRKQKERAVEDITVAAPQAADRLARIGGIIGGQISPDRGLMERQLKETELMRRMLEDIKEIEQRSDETLRRIGEE